MKKKRRKSKKRLSEIQRKRQVRRNIRLGLILLAVLAAALGIVRFIKPGWFTNKYFEIDSEKIDATKPEIDVQLLTVNEYSRPGTPTEKITGIVVHYTANPGATAMDNRNYFEGLKRSEERRVGKEC